MPPPLNCSCLGSFSPGKGILKITPPIMSSSFYLGRMKSVCASPWLSSNILQSLSFKVLVGICNPVNREKNNNRGEISREVWGWDMKENGDPMRKKWGRGDCRWQTWTRRLGSWSHPLNFLFISIRNSPCFKLNRLLIFFMLIEDF